MMPAKMASIKKGYKVVAEKSRGWGNEKIIGCIGDGGDYGVGMPL